MSAAGGAQVLVLLGAAIFGMLGSGHLAYTFFSEKLLPYDRAVIDAMKSTTLTLTRRTTIWDAWVGFNASHSLGAIIIAAFYLLLATQHMPLLAQASSLLLVGIAAGFAYAWLAHQYWFRTPFIYVAIATACFLVAFVLLHFS